MDTSARPRPKLVFGQATGSALVVLAIALQQRMLEKQSPEVEPVSAPGATVPRITPDTPVGLIGEPAAILQAAEGSGLRNSASLSRRRSTADGACRGEFVRVGKSDKFTVCIYKKERV
jgi:hypothetical protein